MVCVCPSVQILRLSCNPGDTDNENFKVSLGGYQLYEVIGTEVKETLMVYTYRGMVMVVYHIFAFPDSAQAS